MSEVNPECFINYLPAEILYQILKSLPGKELFKCRRVCTRWKTFVDGICLIDKHWHKLCKEEFQEVYQNSYDKSQGYSNITWLDLYKSLCLWPKVALAESSIKMLFEESAESRSHRIAGFQIIGNNIAVHRHYKIEYFDLKTGCKTNEIGDQLYVKYKENNDVIALLTDTSKLFLIPKKRPAEKVELDAQVDEFMFAGQELCYFVQEGFNTSLCGCRFDANSIQAPYRMESLLGGEAYLLGFKKTLTILLTMSKLILVADQDYIFRYVEVVKGTNIYKLLNDSGLLNRLPFENVWMVELFAGKDKLKTGQKIKRVFTYGDMAVVGTVDNFINIYHTPDMDFREKEPLKSFNLKQEFDLPDEDLVKNIDVIEIANGHRIFVNISVNICIIDIVH